RRVREERRAPRWSGPARRRIGQREVLRRGANLTLFIQCLQIPMHGTRGELRIVPIDAVFAGNTACTTRVGPDDAGVDCEAFAAGFSAASAPPAFGWDRQRAACSRRAPILPPARPRLRHRRRAGYALTPAGQVPGSPA